MSYVVCGATVITEETFGTVQKVKFAWTDAAGSADGTTTKSYSGAVERLVTVPSGTAAPSADYDVVINDADGTDILMGAGADRHTSNTEQVNASSLGIVANDQLTLAITNAGGSKEGIVYLYIR